MTNETRPTSGCQISFTNLPMICSNPAKAASHKNQSLTEAAGPKKKVQNWARRTQRRRGGVFSSHKSRAEGSGPPMPSIFSRLAASVQDVLMPEMPKNLSCSIRLTLLLSPSLVPLVPNAHAHAPRDDGVSGCCNK